MYVISLSVIRALIEEDECAMELQLDGCTATARRGRVTVRRRVRRVRVRSRTILTVANFKRYDLIVENRFQLPLRATA